MPTISSISGTYGYGRSPQVAPLPGVSVYPRIGTRDFWSFTANGALAFEGNSISNAGTSYVITPNANFSVNVKIWGAGGGSGNGGVSSTFITNQINQAYSVSFDGTGGSIAVTHNTALDLKGFDFTIECWVKPASGIYSRYQSIFSKRRSASPVTMYHGYLRVGSGVISFFNGTSVYESSTTLTPGVWSHCAWVYTNSDSRLKIYVNGTEVLSTTLTIGSDNIEPLVIGNSNGYNYSLNGSISDFRIVKGTAVYRSAFTPPRGPLVAIANTSLLAFRSNSLVDESTNKSLISTAGTGVQITDISPYVNFEYGLESPVQAGSGGAVYGKLEFQAGQSYTVFAGGAGAGISNLHGGGGAASGILIGNAFVTTETLTTLAIAGGGGGANKLEKGNYFLSGSGGGNIGGVTTRFTTLSYSSTSTGTTTQVITAGSVPGSTGLPTTRGTIYYGGPGSLSDSTSTGLGGGGGGGFRGGNWASGGSGNISIDQIELQTVSGLYAITARLDDSSRGTAGDSDTNGRIELFLDEYKASNIVATGGTVTTVPIPGQELAYQYHTFTTNSTFTVNNASGNDSVDVFVVGGGGGASELAAGGGGGVAFKSNLSIKNGTYLVEVGAGGKKADERSKLGVGGVYGGYKGKPSAFYTNSLVSRGFPDSYIKLINSFGGIIRYISPNGDNTSGLTTTTAYTSFNSALSKNFLYNELIVFVVLQGTYVETVSAAVSATGFGDLPTPIHDMNKPRIFVCAPSRVIIQWTPSPSTSTTINTSPMCQLVHPMSAVYGAIFDRIGYAKSDTRSDRLEDLSFFGVTYTGFTVNAVNWSTAVFRGSLYNCVFRDNIGDWGLINPNSFAKSSFTIENCTFATRNNEVALTTNNSKVPNNMIVLKNCAFQKTLGWSEPVLDNVVQNATIGNKYVITAHPDKGVYAGEFGWGMPITNPATASIVSIVGHGGGGGTFNVLLGLANAAGGSGGGSSQQNSRAPSTQFNKEAKVGYSCYGYAGAASALLDNVAGGGGASYLGIDNNGGIGIEFPENSNIYYGAGGSFKEPNFGLQLPAGAFVDINFSMAPAVFNFSRDSYTIECWIKFNETGTGEFNIFQTSNYKLFFNLSTLKFGWNLLYDSGVSNPPSLTQRGETPGTYPIGKWYHVVQLRNGSVFFMYIDGIEVIRSLLSVEVIDVVDTIAKIGPSLSSCTISNLRIVVGTAVYINNFTPPKTNLQVISNTKLLTFSTYSINDMSVEKLQLAATGVNNMIADAGPFAAEKKSLNELAPCSIGLGGGILNGNNLSDGNGTNGTVIVRYIVPGPFTLPVPSSLKKNVIAYGGDIRETDTYKEHIFRSNGTFDLVQVPNDIYFDVIVVGGGGSGGTVSTTFLGSDPGVSGGEGGLVEYRRIIINNSQLINVTIGAGAPGAPAPGAPAGTVLGYNGDPSMFGRYLTANGGNGGARSSKLDVNGRPGALIKNGLFSDNVTYYGGGGGGWYQSPPPLVVGTGGIGGGGNAGTSSSNLGQPGQPNTGGGSGVTVNRASSVGGSGIVIVRYPVYRYS